MLTLDHSWPFLHVRRGDMTMRAAGWTALVVSIVSGATFTPFAKSLSGFLSPLSLLAVSEFLTLAFVLFSFGCLPIGRKLLSCDKRTLLALLATGVTSGVLGPFLYFKGLQTTTALNAILFGKTELFQFGENEGAV